MEAEEVLKLFDSCWSERLILKRKQENPSPAAMFLNQTVEKSEETITYGLQNLRIRSLSDRCLGRNVEAAPKLQRISSGKEVMELSREFIEHENEAKSCIEKQCSRRKKGRKGMSRSLSALEFEEVKGFMDLGFVFTEEDKNPGLISIIPGLEKWGKLADDDDDDEDDENVGGKAEISRPYLSEAWGVLNKRRKENKFLMNWRIPPVENEINMKDHLRIWAHTVASTVR